MLDRIERSFDAACERWRSLYRAAVRQRELHHRIIGDHSQPEAERNHSARLRAQAESQIRLLTEAEGIYEGDFYSWRYFATEGFLPGYNFPRLPISAYVPGRRRRKGRDEFISRPRFLAVSEFGPRALIYHEGARYRVSRVNLDFGSDAIEDTHRLATDTMKRCERCGYAHLQAGEAHLAEVCDRCGDALDTPSRIDHLVRMQNVSLRHAQRITCDEEERQRFGYHLVTAYRFPEVNGRLDRKDAEVHADGACVLTLSYGDATDLYRVNLGWSHQDGSQPRGFNLDLERGYGSRAERLAALRKRCDSRLEQSWLDMVESLGLRLPSDAQYAIPGHRTRPDFFYREENAAIYVDGPPHDAPDQAREDEAKTRALIEVGYIVIRFHHGADWRAVFRRHPDVFGEAPPRC